MKPIEECLERLRERRQREEGKPIPDNAYWHFSNSILEEGKTYTAAVGKPFFGDEDKVSDMYRPSGTQPRIGSFYMTKHKLFASQFGDRAHLVQPVGKFNSCALGWRRVLSVFFERMDLVKGFKPRYGYVLKDFKTNPQYVREVKHLVDLYYKGVAPTSTELRLYDLDKDAENSIIETLSRKILVLKTLP